MKSRAIGRRSPVAFVVSVFGVFACSVGSAPAPTTNDVDSGTPREGGQAKDAQSDAPAGDGSRHDASHLDSGTMRDTAPACPTKAPASTADAACTKRVYVAGGDDNRVILSTDEGTTWQSFEIDHITGDDYINFISVQEGVILTTSLPGMYLSVDGGMTFTLVSSVVHSGFDTYGGQINYGDEGFLVTDNAGTYLSADSTTWTSLTVGDGGIDGFCGHYHGVAFGGGSYVAFQDSGAFREWDGTTFVNGTVSLAPDDVAFGNGVFAAVGQNNASTSTDGKTWTAATSIGTLSERGAPYPGSMLFNGSKFYVYDHDTLFTSTDGATWTSSALSGVIVDVAAYIDGHYFGIGSIGGVASLMLSTDGVTWSSSHVLAADETFEINGPRAAAGRVLK